MRLFTVAHNDSAKCHILGCGDPGVGRMTPKFKHWRDFCTLHLATKFHHPMSNHSKVIVLTNTQTPRRHATPVGNENQRTSKPVFVVFYARRIFIRRIPDNITGPSTIGSQLPHLPSLALSLFFLSLGLVSKSRLIAAHIVDHFPM